MPIQTEGAFESIRFSYQHEIDETFVLQVESHHTDAGPTITIHNLDGGPLSLPLSLFVDTVDFLRGRGAIPGGMPKLATQAPVQGRQASKLAPTRVAGASQQTMPGYHQQANPALYEQAYAPQGSILTSATALGVQPQRQQPPQVRDAAPIDLEGATGSADLEPQFSLTAAKARKEQGGDSAKKIKRRDKNAEADSGDGDPI